MDAVELSLPVTVKLLATDGFTRVGESEVRNSSRADASFYGSCKASDCSPYRTYTKYPLTISGCSSVFRSKKTDTGLFMHENMIPSYKSEENGDTHLLVEVDKLVLVSPKHEGKPLNKKSLKKLSSFSCLKQARTYQTENSKRIAGTDDVDVISREIASDLIRFTYPEKSLVKKKRCQDGMRTDKKNNRASIRAKSFTSKAGFACTDPASGGSNILGICGLKSDLRDFTKHVDELSLNELLDGSYKYHSPCPDKGKKAPDVNENILLSVRKVCSVLPPHGAEFSNGNKKSSVCIPKPNSCSANLSDSDVKDTSIEESVPFSKDPCQANLGDSFLDQPKMILERLALPPSHDLDALLNLSMNSLPLQSTTSMMTFCHSSLPPFPWSFSHSGSWRFSVDSGKLASGRNTCQGRWVRIGNNSTSIGDDQNCFSELELKTFNREDSINQQKVDDLLQYVKALNMPVNQSFDERFSMSRAMTNLPEVRNPDSIISVIGSGVLGPSSFKKLNLMGDTGSSDSHLVSVSKDHVFLRNSESKVVLGCQGNESNMVNPSLNLHFEESEVAQKEQHTGNTHCCSDCCYCYPSKSAADGCDQSSWQLPAPEICKRDRSPSSPRRVAAAEILCEMASCSTSIKTHSHTSGRIKWPKAPSQKTMKVRKSTPSMEEKDRLFLADTRYDPVKSRRLPSVKHKPMTERKNGFVRMNNGGREPVRWSVPTEGSASPGKLERDLDAHQTPSHGDLVRPLGLMQSAMRAEDCDGQQKLRRAMMKTSSLGFGGTYIKDWSRGASKRV